MSGSVDLSIPDGRNMNTPRCRFPSLFSEEDSNLFLRTQKITAAPLGEFRPILSGSVDFEPPGVRNLNFPTLPHLSAVFSEEVGDPLFEIHHVTSALLGKLRSP